MADVIIEDECVVQDGPQLVIFAAFQFLVVLFIIGSKLFERNAPFFVRRYWVLAAVIRKVEYVEHFQNADQVADVVVGVVRLPP